MVGVWLVDGLVCHVIVQSSERTHTHTRNSQNIILIIIIEPTISDRSPSKQARERLRETLNRTESNDGQSSNETNASALPPSSPPPVRASSTLPRVDQLVAHHHHHYQQHQQLAEEHSQDDVGARKATKVDSVRR